jgi:Rieske Fe-S protein
MNHSDDNHGCDACQAFTDRRTFVKHAGLAALSALVMAGMPVELAARMRPSLITALHRGDSNPTYPIPAQDGVQIDEDNQVILVRWKSEVYAFNLSCPHQRAALRWHDSNDQFECPKHHSKYQPDGTYISGRATRSMDRFSLTRTGDNVTVDVNAMHKADVDPAGWKAAAIAV